MLWNLAFCSLCSRTLEAGANNETHCSIPTKNDWNCPAELATFFSCTFLHYANPLRESFCILMGATWEKCWRGFGIRCHDCSDLHTRNSQQWSGQDTAADRFWCHLWCFVGAMVQVCFPVTEWSGGADFLHGQTQCALMKGAESTLSIAYTSAC